MDGHRAQALLLEEVGHEVRVALRDAEGQGAGAAALLQLLVGVSGSGLGRDVAGELLLVEAGVAPGDVPVVDLVRHAEVPEAAEEVLLDALDQVAAVDEVLLAQGEEVAAVGALRGGGEGEQELRAEVVDEPAVGRGRGVGGPGPGVRRGGSCGRCLGTGSGSLRGGQRRGPGGSSRGWSRRR